MFEVSDGLLIFGLALFLDRVLGELPNRLHPVVWMGELSRIPYKLIERLSPNKQRFGGWLIAIAYPSLWSLLVWLLIEQGSEGLSWIAAVFFLQASFAHNALGKAHLSILKQVRKNRADRARAELKSLVSRDTSRLEKKDIFSSSISSIAENFCDSIVAPLLFFLILGVPGAVFYRVVNTLDAMYGYRDERRFLGEGAARLDDALNFIPARISALLFLLVGIVSGLKVKKAIRITKRDRKKTPSPNGGWTMAMMAGLLRIQLSKPKVYTLGGENQSPHETHMIQSWGIVNRASWLLYFLIGGLLWINS